MLLIICELGENRLGKGCRSTLLMEVNEITLRRGKVGVLRDGVPHLQSCAIRGLAAHIAQLYGTLAYHVPMFSDLRRDYTSTSTYPQAEGRQVTGSSNKFQKLCRLP
jgi:hypothetical protein